MASRGTIYFLHGKESGPVGRKSQALAPIAQDLGWQWQAPDMRFTYDPGQRLAYVQQQLAEQPADIIIGSSMGAWVAAQASGRHPVTGLFLLAPALGLPGYQPAWPQLCCRQLWLVHGWQDELIPARQFWQFAAQQQSWTHVLPAGHTLETALPFIGHLWRWFLATLPPPGTDGNSPAGS